MKPCVPPEPVLMTSNVGGTGGARPREIDARPITDKISQFEKSIEHSVLHNPPPPKKLRPPVPCKPPKSAPPPPPTSAAPSLVSTRELTLVSSIETEELESTASSAPLSPLSPALSCAELPDASSRPPHLPRPLSPRDRSPLGGEDSGVHTADSVRWGFFLILTKKFNYMKCACAESQYIAHANKSFYDARAVIFKNKFSVIYSVLYNCSTIYKI